MEFVERTIVFLVGCAFGFIVGYICAHLRKIEKQLEQVDEHIQRPEAHPGREKDENGMWSLKWVSFNNIALFLVVILVAYSAFAAQQASHKVESNIESDRRDLCQSGQNVRAVQRSTVEQVYKLATGSLVRNKEAPPLSASEVVQYNAYIDRVNSFRKEMYDEIKPTAICKAYVEDDDVKPPTSPFPHVNR